MRFVNNRKRVFILGPSHHWYTSKASLTEFEEYETPFGSLPVDLEVVNRLLASQAFGRMEKRVDEAEHSIEMHLPLVHKMIMR